jgi:hypothetical protein
MPELNEVKRGNEVGKTSSYKVIWCACIDCGKERWVPFIKGRAQNKYCKRCMHRGNRNYNWKGGKAPRPDGYIEVWVSPKDFFAPMSGRRGFTLEHRLVMARHLGRFLQSWEIVHHKNGNRADNRIENLEILKCQSDHMVSIQMQTQINKQQKEIENLKERVTLLEAENILLKSEDILAH